MSRLPIRYLLVAVAWCAAWFGLAHLPPRVTPAWPSLPCVLHGHFAPNGQYPGDPLSGARGIRVWGSWGGDDANTGSLELGPFVAPRWITIGIGGYPLHPGNALWLQRADSPEKQRITPRADVGERWTTLNVEIPAGWVGKPVFIEAEDHATGLGGWLAISEPLHVNFAPAIRELLSAIAAWSINGLLLGILAWAAARLLAARNWVGDTWVPLAVAGVVACCGYVAFWAYFAHPLLGQGLSLGLLLVSMWVAMRRRGAALPAQVDLKTVAHLMAAVGFFYLSLLCLFPSTRRFYDLAANRFRDGLPADNALPHATAMALDRGETLRPVGADWQTSDRPPLQAGWQLLTMPVLQSLRVDDETGDGTAAIWLQLLWIPAAYGLLRTLGLSRERSTAWVIVFSLTGFFLQNTVFTWPKLSAAAFGCGAFAIWLWPESGRRTHSTFWVGAAFAGLAWLSHGGIAFSFLALAPWILWRMFRGEFRGWLLATAVFLLFAGPWFAFQKLYDPPGDRLIKMHLAGVPEKDPRSSWAAIRDSYRVTPLPEILANKRENFRMLTYGGWAGLFDFDSATSKGRRDVEFFFPTRALTWWLLGALALPVALFRPATRQRMKASGRRTGSLLGWTLLTLTIWCLLMFGPRTTSIHQGSYATMIALFVVLTLFLEWASPQFIWWIAAIQAATFATTWACANDFIRGPATGWPLLAVAALVLTILFFRCVRSEAPFITSGSATTTRDGTGPGKWWARLLTAYPRALNVAAALVALTLLIAHKVWALRTPQLWAEDGSVFLNDAERLGAAALVQPYQGYLHLIPRLIVGFTNRVADVALWPMCYNLGALAVAAAVLLRMASPRLQLPHKPWLILAFALVAQSGEAFFNITNIQWVSAFFLIQQLLMRRPETHWQRASDVSLIVLAGLTGPFSVFLLPFFVWRSWRERDWRSALVVGTLAVCAAIQIWFLIRFPGNPTAPRPASFDLTNLIAVISERLVVWPFFGLHAASGFSAPVLAVVGGGVLAAVSFGSIASGPNRSFALPILLLCGVLVSAVVWRARAYGWMPNDIANGDRYFYIPRVLFAWLVIWQFDAPLRLAALGARVLCVVGVLTELPHHAIAAPPNYNWAGHCEAIRRGAPATIPTLPEGWTLEYPGRPAQRK